MEELKMQILKDIEPFKEEQAINLQQAQQEYNSAVEKLEQLKTNQEALEKSLESRFSLSDKKDSILTRAKIEVAKKEVDNAKEVLESVKANRIRVTPEEVRKQYEEYVNAKYDHLNKILRVKELYDNLQEAMQDLTDTVNDMQRESYEIKADLKAYTDLEPDPGTYSYHGVIALYPNHNKWIEILNNNSFTYSIRSFEQDITNSLRLSREI